MSANEELLDAEIVSNDVTHLTWDKDQQKMVPKVGEPLGETQFWDPSYYEPSLELAKSARNALVAVMAILRKRAKYNQRFKGGSPVELGNGTLGALGFDKNAKNRALKQMEEAGLIKVTWRERKSPLVKILKQF
jgi:hypothetical protein